MRANENDTGLVCRTCGCRHFLTVRTQPGVGDRIVRIRECRCCGRRTRTVERIIEENIDGEPTG